MTISRRDFVGGTTGLAILVPGLGHAVPFTTAANIPGYIPEKVPSEGQLWDWQIRMNKIGATKYTGSAAHTNYIEFLASNLQSFGIDVVREHYTLPLWQVGNYGLSVTPKSGQSSKIKVAAYYRHSGETPSKGVTAELVYGGQNPNFNKSQDLRGKIVFIDCPGKAVANSDFYTVWGKYSPEVSFPPAIHNAVDQEYVVPSLSDFKKAGAVGVILGWTDLSDAQIAYCNLPDSRAHQGIPGLWVGRAEGDKVRALAGTGATATLSLDATITPDTPTYTLIATLPGMTDDEYVIVNTHTDGCNATEENGGIGILGIAKYFASLPKSARKRTIKFILRTGHFAGADLPSASLVAIAAKYPDLLKKAVAALTIEHLAAREWMDDTSGRYAATGKNEISLIISPTKAMANIALKSLQGSGDSQGVVLGLKTNRFIGEGGGLYRAGIPNIGYIPVPSYLLSGAPNGHIDKLDRRLLASQVHEFVKVVHQMDAMSADELTKSAIEEKKMVVAFTPPPATKEK